MSIYDDILRGVTGVVTTPLSVAYGAGQYVGQQIRSTVPGIYSGAPAAVHAISQMVQAPLLAAYQAGGDRKSVV